MGQSVRHTGIDFLRMLSMFFVVMLHVLGNGGVLGSSPWLSGQYGTAWFLEILAYCAANCFALISGYVGVKAKFRWSRLLNLWLQTVFYTLGIAFAFTLLKPEAVTDVSWVKLIFPVTASQYWYITAYAGMFFFIPFLNLIIEKAERKSLKAFFVVVFIFFCLMPCILRQSPYGLAGGYSMAWLIVLYLMGGYIRKYEIAKRITRKAALLLFFASTTLTWVSKLIIEIVTYRKLGHAEYGGIFVSYLSPMIVINAAALLCLFAQIDFQSKIARNIVFLLSPAALGVYIIHLHPLIWDSVITGCGQSFAAYHPLKMAACVVGMAFIIYMCCSVIEIIRIRLFRLLRVHVLCQRFDLLLNKMTKS